MPKWNEYRVKCTVCGWRGVRHAYECECYDEWSLYCRPGSPGPGCPSWVTYPCPRGGHLKEGKTSLWTTSDSAVVVTKSPQIGA